MDDQVREALQRMAAEADTSRIDATVVARMARTRSRRTIGAALVLTMIGAVGAFAGGKALTRHTVAEPIASQPAPTSTTASGGKISATSADGTLRCTATKPSERVAAGTTVTMDMSLENVSSKAVQYTPGQYAELKVYDAGGNELWDSRASSRRGHGGPGVMRPNSLAPGATNHVGKQSFIVRWAGPLSLAASCPSIALPRVTVSVVAVGPPMDPAHALSRAIRAVRPFLDNCRAEPNRGYVNTTLLPPAGSNIPSMSGKCAADVEAAAGIAIVRLVGVAPRSAGEPQIPRYPGLSLPSDKGTAILIEILVHPDGSVQTLRTDAFSWVPKTKKSAPTFWYADGTWQRKGGVACGGYGVGPQFVWIASC